MPPSRRPISFTAADRPALNSRVKGGQTQPVGADLDCIICMTQKNPKGHNSRQSPVMHVIGPGIIAI